MAGAAHPEAMAPPKKGRTRTAPPRMPASWWGAPRIRTYLLFGATGIVYLLAGTVVLRLVWALGKGPEAWDAALSSLSHPLYLVFHALTLVSLIFVGVRAFGTIQGFTLRSLSMKPSMSTTRSRTMGKFASGSIFTAEP